MQNDGLMVVIFSWMADYERMDPVCQYYAEVKKG